MFVAMSSLACCLGFRDELVRTGIVRELLRLRLGFGGGFEDGIRGGGVQGVV